MATGDKARPYQTIPREGLKYKSTMIYFSYHHKFLVQLVELEPLNGALIIHQSFFDSLYIIVIMIVNQSEGNRKKTSTSQEEKQIYELRCQFLGD